MNEKTFFNHNKGKEIIAIQGLGFVGAVMSLVCSNSINANYGVIGFDLPNKHGKKIVKKMNSGIFPLTADDKKINTFFENSIKKKNFLATTNSRLFSKASVIIVDVNLDVIKKIH